MLGTYYHPTTGQVFDYDSRIPGNMFPPVTGNRARIGIEATSWHRSDNDSDYFILEKWLLFGCKPDAGRPAKPRRDTECH
jgi:hypothetical protein